MKYLWISTGDNQTCFITYPTWIIIPTLSIQSEDVDIEIQICDDYVNQHTALKRLGREFTGLKRGWHCSLDCISKVYLDQHQKSKLKLKFHVHWRDSYYQNIKKIVTWGLTGVILWSHSIVVCALIIDMLLHFLHLYYHHYYCLDQHEHHSDVLLMGQRLGGFFFFWGKKW